MTTKPEPNLLAEIDATCVHGVDPDIEEACDRCLRSETYTTNEYVVRYPNTETVNIDEFNDLGDALDWLSRRPESGGVLFERAVTTTIECGEWKPVQLDQETT